MVLPTMERVVIEIFGGCDYACKMCPQSIGRGKSFTRKMPFKLFEEILDQLSGDPVINIEGSGEPTLASDLPKYIQACTDRGFRTFMFTNGRLLNGQFMKDVIDAGLTFVRFSVIGYNSDLYQAWMTGDNFDIVKQNMIDTRDYISTCGSNCELSSYHLILDNNNIEYEMNQYIDNIITPSGSTGYIWKQHNWSGNHLPDYSREGKKTSCGRPLSAVLTIRAGGNGGKRGAVTPCCQTMGEPNEGKSVLGHASETSLDDIWFGEKYEELRELHRAGDFDNIDYCKNCDFLIEDPEVLVWSNASDASVDHVLGTDLNLKDYE